jgi:hypothetical protein
MGSILPKGDRTQNKVNEGDRERYSTCCLDTPVNSVTMGSEIASDGLGIPTLPLFSWGV